MPRGQAFGGERELRLRPEFGHLYPRVLAGVWMPAWAVAEQLVEGRRGEVTGTGGRVCDPSHFEFRGGQGRPRHLRALRTRAADPASDAAGGPGPR